MSSLDTNDTLTVRARMLRSAGSALAVAVVSATLLSACGGSGGFRPMYAASAGGESVVDKMAQVSVTTIPGRVGQRLRNELLFQTTGSAGHVSGSKRYKLDLVLRSRLTSALVNIQGDAEAQIYHLDATFELTDLRSGNVVFKGQSFGRATFQRFQAIYGNVRAKRDAENRAAGIIAHDLKGRLAAFLSQSA